ncbi:8484_t:CDS:1 [Ambispora leptoticha]|uniref:8484_t:CDS:1 n=1 Tax=Ambispora leptoticha TaxID=144679 RepID=A0A9N9EB81_9GLOM|nr:8484_t:CDS:1 [Ambispora leptoticha]
MNLTSFTLVITLIFCLYTREINAIPAYALTNENLNKNYLQSTLLTHNPNKPATILTEAALYDPVEFDLQEDEPTEEPEIPDEERQNRFIPIHEIRHREIYHERPRPRLGIDVLRIYLDVLADLLERLYAIDERIPLDRLSELVGRKPGATPNIGLLGGILGRSRED